MTWTSNIIVSKYVPQTDATVTVTIDTTRDTENLQNALVFFTPPASSKEQTSGVSKKDTKLIDLLRIEERITVDGILSTDTVTTASQKKANLKQIFKAGGVFNMTYEGETFTAIMERIEFDRNHMDGSEPGIGESGFMVKFTALRGVNMVGSE